MNLEAIAAELKPISPFEWLCVGKLGDDHTLCATYVITMRLGDHAYLNDVAPLFYRTVNLKTGKTVKMFAHPELSVEAQQLLAHHYSEDYVHSDGLCMMVEFCDYSHEYVENGKSTMGTHEEFGKNIYYADVDELRAPGGEYVSLIM